MHLIPGETKCRRGGEGRGHLLGSPWPPPHLGTKPCFPGPLRASRLFHRAGIGSGGEGEPWSKGGMQRHHRPAPITICLHTSCGVSRQGATLPNLSPRPWTGDIVRKGWLGDRKLRQQGPVGAAHYRGARCGPDQCNPGKRWGRGWWVVA